MSNQLIVEKLVLFRGERCLIDGLSFTVDAGHVLVLEGANGSGKTSLLKALAGLVDIEDGAIRWNGADVRDERQAFSESLVWMAHRVGFKADLTLTENLQFETALRPRGRATMDAVIERLGLARLVRLPLRALSAGQQRRVALARMLLAAAPLWLMDEPFANLDRDGRKLVRRVVEEHVSNGGLCVMAAHEEVGVEVPMDKLALG